MQALDRYTRWANDREARLVRVGHEEERRMYLGALLRFAATMAAVLLLNVEPGVVNSLALVLLGALAGSAVMNGVRRAAAYRRGWLEGRQRFLLQGQRYSQEGRPPADWLTVEVDHDSVIVLGLPPLSEGTDG